MKNMAECPMCDGNGFDGFEEGSGAPFACYYCGTSGMIPAADRAAFDRDRALEYDRANSLAANIVRCRPDIESQDPACYAEHRALFTRLPGLRASAPAAPADFDDIPF